MSQAAFARQNNNNNTFGSGRRQKATSVFSRKTLLKDLLCSCESRSPRSTLPSLPTTTLPPWKCCGVAHWDGSGTTRSVGGSRGGLAGYKYNERCCSEVLWGERLPVITYMWRGQKERYIFGRRQRCKMCTEQHH